MAEEDRAELEDFALTALDVLVGRTGDGRIPGVSIGFPEPIADAGFDPAEVSRIIAEEIEEAGGPPPAQSQPLFRSFVIPNLKRIGLLSERIRPRYEAAGYLQNTV